MNAKHAVNLAIKDIMLQCQRERLVKQAEQLYLASERLLRKNRGITLMSVPQEYYAIQPWRSM